MADSRVAMPGQLWGSPGRVRKQRHVCSGEVRHPGKPMLNCVMGTPGAWNDLGRAGARVAAGKTCNVPFFFKRSYY